MSSPVLRSHWHLLFAALGTACGSDVAVTPGGAADADAARGDASVDISASAEAGLTDFDAAGEPFEQAEASVPPADGASERDDARAPEVDSSGMSGDELQDAALPADGGGTTDLPDQDGGDMTALDAGPGTDGASDASFAADPTRIVGHVRVRPNLLVDGDTLDSRRVQTSNDHVDAFNPERDEAQLLLKPGWVTGYLGPRAGDSVQPAANTLDAGVVPPSSDAATPNPTFDTVDYYKVRLNRGDAITLYFESLPVDVDTSDIDLDLYLFEAGSAELGSTRLVADSQGSGNVEQVHAPHGGTFWIAVERYQDEAATNAVAAARYALTVGVPVAPSVQSTISKTKLSVASVGSEPQAMVELSAGPLTSNSYNQLVKLGLLEPNPRGERRARLHTSPLLSEHERARQALRALKRLRRTPGIASAELVRSFQPQSIEAPNDPEFVRQWQHAPIDLHVGWRESRRDEQGNTASQGGLGEGVVVAVIDTGVALEHPDFVNADGTSQLLAGIDMIANAERADDGDGVDFDPTEPSNPTKPGGGMFHGTHCAGNIAAALDNAEGVVGTAPRAKILPIRALGASGGDEAEIATAILYAAGLPNDSGELPAQKADIISLSLGGPGRSELLAAAIASANDAGSIVVAAAGNFQSFAEDYSPGGEEGVVTVSAVDASYDLAWYSNYGATSAGIDVAGVGGDEDQDRNFDGANDGVVSLSYQDHGKTLTSALAGTSMAAAQVAGVVALMKGVWPAMTSSDLMALLPEITIDLAEEGPDPWFGYGLIDAAKAVSAARAHAGIDVPPLAVLRSSALALDFAKTFEALPLEMTAFGAGDVQITGVTTSEPWVSVTPGGLGVNYVAIDRAFIDASSEARDADVTWHSTAGELSVRVHAVPDRSLEVGDVGEIDVVLLDADTGEVVDHVVASSASGYAFSFDAVPPGAYRVHAVGRLQLSDQELSLPLETLLQPSFGQFLALGPFGDRVLCRQLERSDCDASEGAEIRVSLGLNTDVGVLQTR